MGRRLLGKNFSPCLERVQLAAFAKQAGEVNRRGGDEAAAKDGHHEDLVEKIRSKERMDAKNRWWVSELLAEDCEKVWTHTGWEDAKHKWYEWREYMKNKDEKEKWRRMHQRKLEKMTKSAEGSAGLLHKITKPTMWIR